MKFLTKTLIASLLTLSAVSMANADQVIHLTGSTAFRAATITAIENVMNANGAYTVAYVGNQPTVDGTELGVTEVILRGTISGATGTTVVKCEWTGSTGGILVNAKQLDITQVPGPHGWMAESNIGSTTSITVGNKTMNAVPLASASFALDTAHFAAETNKSDVNMEDSHQNSTLVYNTPVLTEDAVGVIVFEWVVNNQATAGSPTATAPIFNITNQLARVVFENGGAFLSQFTNNSADTTPVYGAGRNFDSGTRLSQLAETGIGVLGNVQQMQVDGTLGAGNTMTTFELFAAETLFPAPFTRNFAVGQSGYSSGGTLADALATKGSLTATDGGSPSQAKLLGPNGYLIGYLGRNDVNRAVQKKQQGGAAATNTAHRLTYNGVADWTGGTAGIDAQLSNSGSPAWDDTPVQEGAYQGWEFERLARRSGLSTNQNNVINTIRDRIINFDAGVSGTALSTMHVTKDTEGGLIVSTN